jgi:hypothetical protein
MTFEFHAVRLIPGFDPVAIMGGFLLKKLTLLAAVWVVVGSMTAAHAQRIDFSFGLGSASGPSAQRDASGNVVAPSFARGVYINFGGNVLFFHNMGLNAEVSVRATQANYSTDFFPGIKYRPVFYDFNGIWAPKYDRVGPELMAGIGAESLRFYVAPSCGAGCINYRSFNHFAGHVGGGLKLYVKGNLFVRPEAHFYFVHNNDQPIGFNGGKIARYGASIGYSFGGQ